MTSAGKHRETPFPFLLLRLQLVAQRHQFIHFSDDAFLFFKRREWKWVTNNLYFRNIGLSPSLAGILKIFPLRNKKVEQIAIRNSFYRSATANGLVRYSRFS